MCPNEAWNEETAELLEPYLNLKYKCDQAGQGTEIFTNVGGDDTTLNSVCDYARKVQKYATELRNHERFSKLER